MSLPRVERLLLLQSALLLCMIIGAWAGAPRSILTLLGIAAAGGAILIAVQQRRAARELRTLAAAARRLAEGDAEARLPSLRLSGATDLPASIERIASQLRAQRGRLSSQRELLEAVLTGMEDSILVLRPGGRLLFANRAASTLLSLPIEAEDRPLTDLIRLPELNDSVQEALQTRPSSFEATGFGPSQRILAGRAAPLAPGGSAAVVVVVRDVTELRTLEAMRRDFAASASHELRTPVTAIRGYAETLAGGALDDRPTAERFVQALNRQATRLGALVDDLLDLSRIESGALRLSPEPLPLAPALQALLDPLKSEAQAKALTIRFEEDDEGLVGWLDPTALEMIVGNLLENAIRYTPAGGQVTVTALRIDRSIRIEVRDSGPGIEPRHQARIFERFYRADPGRSRQEGGTGLGLAIAKHVAQQSGGDVGVQSRPGKGACFWVSIPASQTESNLDSA